MGMFGNLFQKKQPAMGDFTFHNSLPYAGSADGLPTPAPAPDDGNQRIKPSFMGILADALAGAAGTAPQYAPMLQKQKQRQMDLADYNRRRQDDLAQWQAEQQWKIDHPEPTGFQRDLTAAGIDPNSPQGIKLYTQKVTNAANPLQGVMTYDERGGQSLQFVRPGGDSAPSVPSISSPEEYNALPPGAHYAAPDGHVRVKGGAPEQGGATFP